jgi:glycosyltransferase involved in cell wall biosynthesis
MKISIIIPTKDRAPVLNRTIKSLYTAIENITAEIIVVNDSPLNKPEIPFHPKAKIIPNSGAGAASARNTGVANSDGELLLFLDDDMLISEGNILRTLELHKGTSGKAYNFFWIYPPDLIETLKDSNFGRYILNNFLFTNSYRFKINGRINELIKENGLTSQYFSILRSDFLQSGGYDENIPFAGIEDRILFKSLQKNNIEIFLSTSDVIFQNESDRLSLLSAMERTKRGARTIRIAKENGHDELGLNPPFFKKFIYSWLVHFKPLIYFLVMKLPNSKKINFLYSRSTNVLLGLSQYEGFYKNK